MLFQLREKHIEHLDCVLSQLRHSGLKLKLGKCHFVRPRVGVLRHVISPEKLAMALRSEEAIRELQFPPSFKQLS